MRNFELGVELKKSKLPYFNCSDVAAFLFQIFKLFLNLDINICIFLSIVIGKLRKLETHYWDTISLLINEQSNEGPKLPHLIQWISIVDTLYTNAI